MILFYDLEKVLELAERDALPDQCKSQDYSLELVRKYHEIVGGSHGRMMLDRTGAVKNPLMVTIKSPIPAYEKEFSCLPIECIIAARCAELVSLGKRINVLWSGGVDSSTLLFYMMEICPREQLRVQCSWSSIVESGSLFEKHISSRVETIITTWNGTGRSFKFDDPSTDIYVSGSGSDKIWGRSAMTGLWAPSGMKLTTQSREFRDIMDEPWEEHYPDKVRQFFAPSLERSPRPIKTVYDFAWWLTFNFGYQAEEVRLCRERPPETCRRMYPFYCTQDFQRYAVSSCRYPFDVYEYRSELKRALSQVCQDKVYIANKKKASSGGIGSVSGGYLFTSDDWRTAYV